MVTAILAAWHSEHIIWDRWVGSVIWTKQKSGRSVFCNSHIFTLCWSLLKFLTFALHTTSYINFALWLLVYYVYVPPTSFALDLKRRGLGIPRGRNHSILLRIHNTIFSNICISNSGMWGNGISSRIAATFFVPRVTLKIACRWRQIQILLYADRWGLTK